MRPFLTALGVFILFSAAVLPVHAAVTKTSFGTVSEILAEREISSGTWALCSEQIIDDITLWWRDSDLLRRETDEGITGGCVEGTTYICTSGSVVTAQKGGTMSRTCTFSHPDGSLSNQVSRSTYSNGMWRVVFSRWT